MAITSSNLTAGKATIGGRGGKGGGQTGLVARVAAGVAVLGCAAALALGGLRAGDEAGTGPQAAPVAPIIQASGSDRQQFLEQNLHLPGGTPPAIVATVEGQRFLERNLDLPTGAWGGPSLAPTDPIHTSQADR